jgi:hypothetical protein
VDLPILYGFSRHAIPFTSKTLGLALPIIEILAAEPVLIHANRTEIRYVTVNDDRVIVISNGYYSVEISKHQE